ncbi:MAG: GntR family transcriptional regulator [Deltaproteobacteria bacterium]|jgi:GntR family transcriptional regulator|nr:GntR family transcriptional regulator [Deltaproteobacteria bacterium]
MPQALKAENSNISEAENWHGDNSPAYQRLAESIRQNIVDGTYKSGEKIPSEVALCRSTGLALLTVRQALGVLVDEGLLERFPGRGTFVTELNWRKAVFVMHGLDDKVSSDDIRVRIVCSDVRRATEEVAKKLGLGIGSAVGYLKRTIGIQNRTAFMVQEGFLLLDPFRPIMEAELASTYLIGLFKGSGQGLIKTAKMLFKPGLLSQEDAVLLGHPEGTVIFRLEYTFYDSAAKPLAFGFFVIPEDALTLSSTIGVPLPLEGDYQNG